MNEYQPGDAVFRLGADEIRMREVVCMHPDGGITVELADPKLSPEDRMREKVMPDDLIYADPALRYFEWGHLPEFLQAISKRFADLANSMVKVLPICVQRDVFLQKLIEAKDAAVRARLP